MQAFVDSLAGLSIAEITGWAVLMVLVVLVVYMCAARGDE